MYAVMITLHAKPGNEAELARASRAVVAPSRREPACLFFDLLANPDDPGEIVFYEAYRDRSGFEAHLAAPHVKSWQEAALPLIDRSRIRMPSHVSLCDDLPDPAR